MDDVKKRQFGGLLISEIASSICHAVADPGIGRGGGGTGEGVARGGAK